MFWTISLILWVSSVAEGDLSASTEAIRSGTASFISVSEETADNSQILVEIFLSKDQKDAIEIIKKEFGAVSITKVRHQVFRIGNPPENIAIGRNVPADVARLAIRLAVTYNRRIKLLLPEERLAPHYIAFGTSIFDESFQVPIHPEDLERLSDPALTTEQFHALYRHLTGEDKRTE